VSRRKPASARKTRPATGHDAYASSIIRQGLVVVIALKLAGVIAIFDAHALEAFDLMKSLYSRATEWVIVALIVLLLIRYGTAIVPRTWLWAFVVAFLAANVASVVFALDKYTALYGATSRYLGLTYLVDMAVLAVAVAVACRTLRDWAVLAVGVAIGSALAIGYGVLQALGRDFITSWSEDARLRPFGTLGNADMYAHMLTIVVALCAGVVAFARGRAVSIQRPVALVLGLGALALSAFVATRGSLIGLAALALALPVIALRVYGSGLSRRGSLVLISGSVLAVFALVIVPTPLSSRIQQTLGGIDVRDRVLIWESAARAIGERPVFGWGTDGFHVAYPQFRQVEANAVMGPDINQSSAHDWVLQQGATIGLAGLAALVALIAATTWSLWRHGLAARPALAAPLLLAYVAYWAQGLVTVGSIGVDWLPWAVIGGAAALSGERAPSIPLRARTPALFGAGLVAAALLLASTGLGAYRANLDAKVAGLGAAAAIPTAVRIAAGERATQTDGGRAANWSGLGRALSDAKRWRESADAFERATRADPYLADYWEDLARSRSFQALDGDPSGQLKRAALDAGRRAIDANPTSPSPHYILAQIAFLFGDAVTALDEARIATRLYPTGTDYEPVALQAAARVQDRALARRALEEIASLRETANVRIALAKLDLALGDTAAALREAKRALELSPGNAEAAAILKDAGAP
jgi:O-antigen ligase